MMHIKKQTSVCPFHLLWSTGPNIKKFGQSKANHKINTKLYRRFKADLFDISNRMYLRVVSLDTTFRKKFIQNISMRIYLSIVDLLLYFWKLFVHGIYKGLLVIAESNNYLDVIKLQLLLNLLKTYSRAWFCK